MSEESVANLFVRSGSAAEHLGGEHWYVRARYCRSVRCGGRGC